MRIKRGLTRQRRHRRILKQASGFRGARGKLIRPARLALERSLKFAYRDRRQRKRQFRRLWVVRINAAAREYGLSYSRLMNGLKRAGVEVDRKILADLAVTHPKAFSELAELAKSQAA
ncbi:MAG: 50S ribosomal protein L20 [Deltaproteobacteria bacterium]|nr:50S ribosomal protein L20 [Myxococcales bacterium]MCZ6569599.1 50S ribosomal protein L20 [Deltaproteobacteria bacterium]MCZ6713432.1 50S ribosomal protein L20 [Deltaproteobacteria bacterium]MCZ6823185.1 50S ribosomal protein L20 [Deltaproteobacteria bacterium]TDI98638.1 MAG: 50S ribosomal protein L20 [Deltaproteobacteria bacterium]